MGTKLFSTHDVMSVVTGRLMGGIGGVYEVLNWMTGESLFTHQLPRVGREAVPVILAMHPHLASAIEDAEQVTPENFQDWRDRWVDRFGPQIAVPTMNEDQHERIDAISELAEIVPPDRIIVVKDEP